MVRSRNLEKAPLKLNRCIAGNPFLPCCRTTYGERMADSQSRVVTVNRVSLRTVETGRGQGLIVIHGSLDGMLSFRRQVPAFAERYRVVSYARRHHPPSESPAGTDGYTLGDHVADLLALMDALDMEQPHIVGSSYGAYVALAMALRSPQRARSLVLGEPPILPFLERTAEGSVELAAFMQSALEPAREACVEGNLRGGVAYFVDGIRELPGAFDALPEAAQSELLRFGPELALELTTERERFMPAIPCEALARLTTPVLLVTGERSPRLFSRITDELARCLPNAHHIDIPGAGHAMHVMQPALYTQAVLDFLASRE